MRHSRRTVVITGAANGLGAAFTKVYATEDGTEVLCLDRQPGIEPRSNAQHHLVEIASEASVQDFARHIEGTAIDLLIHSAGIRGLVPSMEEQHPDNVEACETLEVMNAETMANTFRINTVGTFLLLRALLPNLRLAKHAKVVVMSSRMGSIGNNRAGNRAAGGAYAYRASKAALNAIVRSFAADEPDITFVMCHPGRVETNLVRCKEEGAISADESVQGMVPLIELWSSQDSGKFYDRFGKAIEW